MNPRCADALDYPTTIACQFVRMVLTAVGTYAAVIDPRPDLAIPARSARILYAWWW